MALLTPEDFTAKWAARFADNTTGAISEADLREFASDTAVLAGDTSKFEYDILIPNETEIFGDYNMATETITAIHKSSNIATVEYRTDWLAWKNIEAAGNMPFTRTAGSFTDYRITWLPGKLKYGKIIIEGTKDN